MPLPLRYLQCSTSNCGPCASFKSFVNPMGGLHFQQVAMHPKFVLFYPWNVCRVIAFRHVIPKDHFNGRLELTIDEEPFKTKYLQNTGSSLERIENASITTEKPEVSCFNEEDEHHHDIFEAHDCSKSSKSLPDKEINRRRKIGLANKGRVPWNKGRKHSEVSRERIKKRTIEALSDPKVRKKMSEWPHSHSEQSKARIGIALKRIWYERLKRKKSQEKCHSVWAGSIAEAAKEGGHGQQALDWSSYDKMKAGIILEDLRRKAGKAREKEIARLRAERAARDKAENVAKFARRREERKLKAKAREMKALRCSEPANAKQEKAMSKGLKLKARLSKFHRRKKQLESLIGNQKDTANEPHAVLEDVDVELLKIGKLRREVSLADQIRAARNSKVLDLTEDNTLTPPSDDSYVEIKGDS